MLALSNRGRVNSKGNVLVIEESRRLVEAELASTAVLHSLRKLSVQQLEALRPTGPYVPLIDALIAVRGLMDDGQ